MERRTFLKLGAFTGISSALIGKAAMASPTAVKRVKGNWRGERIFNTACPAQYPGRNRVGVISNSNYLNQDAMLYAKLFPHVVLFTNGDQLNPLQHLKLLKQGLEVIDSAIVQINELPDALSINTSTGELQVDCLFDPIRMDFEPDNSNA